MDRKPAAKIDPIKDTPSLKEPITTSYLGKILRQAESELPVDMRPIRKPAAKIDPIKDTPSLKEPITTSYLGKILRQA